MIPLVTLSNITGIAASSVYLAQTAQQGGFQKPPYGGTPSDPWGKPGEVPNAPPAQQGGFRLPEFKFPDPIGDVTNAATAFVRQQGLNIALGALIVLSIYALLQGGD